MDQKQPGDLALLCRHPVAGPFLFLCHGRAKTRPPMPSRRRMGGRLRAGHDNEEKSLVVDEPVTVHDSL
jgi:hypothetical protein